MRAPLVCAALLAGCWVSGSNAHTSEEFWDLSLEQLTQAEVNVASRSSERARDASSSVTVFTRRDIEATGVTTLEQLMAFAPGFAVQRSVDNASASSSFAVRGRRRGGHNRDVLVLRDGLPLNTELLGGAGFAYRDLPLHNVKQIEVIRGPGSALYGSNAFVGVINIITDDNLNDAGISIGSHDYYGGYADSSLPAGTGRLIAQAQVFDGHGEMYRDINDGVSLGTEDVRAPRRGHDATLKWKNDTVTASVSQVRRDAADFVVTRFVDDRYNSEQVEANAAQLDISLGNPASVRHNAMLAYKADEEESVIGFLPADYVAFVNTRVAGGFALPVRDLAAGSRHESNTWLGEWQSEFALGDKQRLLAGASWRRYVHSRSDIFGNYDVVSQTDQIFPFTTYDAYALRAPAFTEEHISREIGGLFVQDRIQVHPDVRWDIGLRYDHYSSIGEAFSPRSSAVWAVHPATDLKLMYARAFRVPTFEELYNTRFNIDLGNPDLQPETIDTLEAAWAQRIAGKAESILTVYMSDVDDGVDPQTRRRNSGGIYELPLNTSELSYSGFEWELLWQVNELWSVRGALHHSFHRDGDIANAPQNSASVIASYKRDAWLASITGVYYDRIETAARAWLNDYTLWGLVLQYDIDAHWRLAFSAQNLFDTSYRTYTRRYNTTTGDFSDGLPGEGAQQLLTLSYNY